MSVRLNRAIANSGLCSRRNADLLIAEGRVQLNGATVELMATQVEPTDLITVDGKALPQTATATIMLNKPRGYLCSRSDPHHDKTIYDLLPEHLRHLDMAGRLDQDSEGLLILSSDGDLLQKLTHPRHEHTKIYEVDVRGEINSNTLRRLNEEQFILDEHPLQVMKVELISKDIRRSHLKIYLKEGRKRQIRRVMDLLGHRVLYLRRIQIGMLNLGDLGLGAFRHLTEHDVIALSTVDREPTTRLR